MNHYYEVCPYGSLLAEPTRNGIHKGTEYQGKGIPVIKMGEVYDNRVINYVKRDLYDLSKTEIDKLYVQKEDILFCRTSLVPEGIGHCAIVNDLKEPTTFSSNLIRARMDKTKVYPNFYRYYFSSPQGIEQLISIARGTSVTTITGPDISSLLVPLPPLPEQRAIADVLGALDNKIELNQKMNANLESLAQALFKRSFLDNPERESWQKKTIGEVVTIMGGTTPSTTNSEYWENGTIQWATPKDLAPLQNPFLLKTNSQITDKGLQQISSGLLLVGTLLMSSRAPIGYLAIAEIPVAINQGFIAIKCTQEMPNYYMLNWVKANMDEIIGRANGTTFLEISKSNFRPIHIEIPPIEMVKEFNSVVEPLYRKVVANLLESNTLAELRDTLLPKLMSGQVRITV